ncbi:Nitrogen regulatory protein P-II [Acididesulfobacillus acetoxydans]|uniref:Nitrogen regulatory protein P-II n=1 Tax=Acididesulfobacillus acetoxydans TaxID=1561005 RepID=A0A8S0X037_9FIRM|nr:P-II family nitrogen regulator [Acididesulfobacillus acetoxydans]CAA7602341.1 Nitrogen regulatory protein P-II [Acididesulfobacillus acetoxydans]CEJ08424.1 Nitrogen regulatory protein P-II [Acididesulfobacillus acetoxydans]
MKEIMAFVRRHQVPATKKALEDANFPALTIQSVEGRGKQGGIGGWAAEVDPELNRVLTAETAAEARINWIPKRMLTLAVQDEEVQKAVQIIISANQTGHMGDGKIFVCSLADTLRVRTGENGPAAVT